MRGNVIAHRGTNAKNRVVSTSRTQLSRISRDVADLGSGSRTSTTGACASNGTHRSSARMPKKTFKLVATISSDNPTAVRGPLERALGSKAKIEPTDDGFRVEATLSGESAKDLNRQLLSEMRRAERKTRLRAE